MLFLVDVDLMNCVASECGLLGFKVETQCFEILDDSTSPHHQISD